MLSQTLAYGSIFIHLAIVVFQIANDFDFEFGRLLYVGNDEQEHK